MQLLQSLGANASVWRLSDLDPLPWKSMSHSCGAVHTANYDGYCVQESMKYLRKSTRLFQGSCASTTSAGQHIELWLTTTIYSSKTVSRNTSDCLNGPCKNSTGLVKI